jgi:hypothetical protein
MGKQARRSNNVDQFLQGGPHETAQTSAAGELHDDAQGPEDHRVFEHVRLSGPVLQGVQPVRGRPEPDIREDVRGQDARRHEAGEAAGGVQGVRRAGDGRVVRDGRDRARHRLRQGRLDRADRHPARPELLHPPHRPDGAQGHRGQGPGHRAAERGAVHRVPGRESGRQTLTSRKSASSRTPSAATWPTAWSPSSSGACAT